MLKEDPPLVYLKVTNPITFIKSWWKRVMANEGMSLSIKVRPLTTISIAAIVTLMLTGAGFGLGRITLPIPETMIKYVPAFAATPTPDLWRPTAFTGTLKFTESTRKYYLITTSSEAITLEVPTNIDLSKFVGRRILASGNYNKTARTLVVLDAQDLEVLPTKAVTIPTLTTTPSPKPTITPTSESDI